MSETPPQSPNHTKKIKSFGELDTLISDTSNPVRETADTVVAEEKEPNNPSSASEQLEQKAAKEQYFTSVRADLISLLVGRGLTEERAQAMLFDSLDKEFAKSTLDKAAIDRIAHNLHVGTVSEVDAPTAEEDVEIANKNETVAIVPDNDQETGSVIADDTPYNEVVQQVDDFIPQLDKALESGAFPVTSNYQQSRQILHQYGEKLHTLRNRLVNLPTWETNQTLLPLQQRRTADELLLLIEKAKAEYETVSKNIQAQAGFKRSFGEYAAVREEMNLGDMADPAAIEKPKRTGWWDTEFQKLKHTTAAETTIGPAEVAAAEQPPSEEVLVASATEKLEAGFIEAVQQHVHNLRLLLEAEGRGSVFSTVSSNGPLRKPDITRLLEASETKYNRLQKDLRAAGATDLVVWADEQIAPLEIKFGWRKKPSLLARAKKRFFAK